MFLRNNFGQITKRTQTYKYTDIFITSEKVPVNKRMSSSGSLMSYVEF